METQEKIKKLNQAIKLLDEVRAEYKGKFADYESIGRIMENIEEYKCIFKAGDK